MAVDPIEVKRLLMASRAACDRRWAAVRRQNRSEAKRMCIEALDALQAALALDPTRSAPAWREGSPRDVIQVGDGMIGFYTRYIADATAAGV